MQGEVSNRMLRDEDSSCFPLVLRPWELDALGIMVSDLENPGQKACILTGRSSGNMAAWYCELFTVLLLG